MSAHRDWKVGDKVVCVKHPNIWQRKARFFGMFNRMVAAPCLTIGEVYTLSEIGVGTDRVTRIEKVGVQLVEDQSDLGNTYHSADNFRPVQKRTTDISIFTALLNPTPQDIKTLTDREHRDDADALDEEVLRAFILANRDESYP